MTDISRFGFRDDVEFARYLVKDVGVAAVPGSSFYRNGSLGRTKLRFCFCKRDETLAEADRRLEKLVAANARVH
jgi:aminotransferase